MAPETSETAERVPDLSASGVHFFFDAQIDLSLATRSKKKKNFSYPPSGPDATRSAMLEPLGLVPLPGLGLFFSPDILAREKVKEERLGREKEKEKK